MLKPRYYQKKAVDDFFDFCADNHGKHPLIVLPTGCLSGDTIINENRCTIGRKKTIESMYLAFNGLKKRKKYNYNKKHKTYVRSYNGNTIQLNEVESISYSGIKDLYLLSLENGLELKATQCHKIMTRGGWKRVNELSVNDEIMCDTLKARSNGCATKNDNGKRYKGDSFCWNLWNHPYAHEVKTKKEKRGFSKRIEKHRAIYEANLNSISFDDYKKILRTDRDKSKILKYIDPSVYDIHHIDGDPYNNTIENLQKLKKRDHQILHSKKSRFHFNQGIPIYSKVKSIKYHGKDHTYDIGCYENHNFVANGIIVHNSGKSFVQALIVDRMLTFPDVRILLITHQKWLIEQNASELLTFLDDRLLNVGIYSAGLKSRDTDSQILFAGIQSVYKKAYEIGFFDLILVDECHRIPQKSMGTYRKFLKDMFAINPKVIIGGLSATPYRMGTGLLTEGDDSIFDDICHITSIPELIDPQDYRNKDRQQYLCEVVSKKAVKDVDVSKVHKRGGEFIAPEMEAAFMAGDNVPHAVSEIVQLTKDRNKVLIFTSGIEHCERVMQTFHSMGHDSACIHSQQPDDLNQEILDAFKKGLFKYLCNVDVLTTGFNEKAIDCICLLRATESPGLYYQICIDSQTEILTKRGFLKYNEIKRDDIPATFNMHSNEIEWDEIKNITIRNIYDSEYFNSIESSILNFRITNEHELLVRSRRKNKYKKERVEKTVNRKDFVEVPVSGIQTAIGTGLRECDIQFLGWFLSDGNLNKKNNAITISQSVTNDHYCKEIEKCIIDTGMKYGKHRIKRKNGYNDQIIFTISKGTPRGRDSQKTGWNYLSDYIDKNINENYERMTRGEIEILLEAIFHGDGCKRKNISWKSKTKAIAMGENEIYANRIQSLLIRRGFRCNMSSSIQKTKWNKTPKKQYYLRIKDQRHSTIPGVNNPDGKILNKKNYKRTRIKKENNIKKNETVWCVSTGNGTIITRRNGKPLIMGNCGRGLRMHPSKKNCLILDFGGNILRHGPIDKIEIKKKVDGTHHLVTAPQKICDRCQAVVAAATRTCPTCGYVFPIDDEANHEKEASTADILSKFKKPEVYPVENVRYSLHIKEGKPKSLRVEYVCDSIGINKFSEWVCIEHEGFAKKKAEKWIEKRYHGKINTVTEALLVCDEFEKPIKIVVDINEKFPRIISYTFEKKKTKEQIDQEKSQQFQEALENLL